MNNMYVAVQDCLCNFIVKFTNKIVCIYECLIDKSKTKWKFAYPNNVSQDSQWNIMLI